MAAVFIALIVAAVFVALAVAERVYQWVTRP